jgi:hypothetical protein
MNEARRFLRYITPGILFGVLAVFFLWIAMPAWTMDILKACIFLPGNSIALAVGSLLASGALGYLFATLHHCCHWHSPTDQNVINHTDKIAALRKTGLIPPSKHTQISPRLEALITISVLWFERLESGGPIGNSEERVAAFGDLAHAAGTARVATACALLVAVLVSMFYGNWAPSFPNTLRYIVMLGLGAAITKLFHDAYCRTGIISQHIYEDILEDALVAESTKRNDHKKNVGAAAEKEDPRGVTLESRCSRG